MALLVFGHTGSAIRQTQTKILHFIILHENRNIFMQSYISLLMYHLYRINGNGNGYS